MIFRFCNILFGILWYLFSYYVKAYYNLQLIVGLNTTPPHSLIWNVKTINNVNEIKYDTISSFSPTQIGTQLFLSFLVEYVRSRHMIHTIIHKHTVWYSFPRSDTQSLKHKHIVGMIQLPTFWYTNSRSKTCCRYDRISLFLMHKV